MSALSGWSTTAMVLVFLGAAAFVTVLGIALSKLVDELADRTGIGEAIAGAVLLGASTSLSGLVVSITAAWGGHPRLAVSNSIGGILAQTAFLAIADFFHPRANLEHAAASAENLIEAVVLIALLAIPLAAGSSPAFTIASVHPATLVMLAGYLYGLKLVRDVRRQPMWLPRWTAETREDLPDQNLDRRRSMPALAGRLIALAAAVAFAGWVLGEIGSTFVTRFGLSESVVGGLFTAVATSLPELVTTVAAVRRGALTLAVGGIVGGNMFDTLFIACSDVAYRDGSIYHAIGAEQRFVLGIAIVLTAVVVLGLLRREERGFARIGFEGGLVLALYAASVLILTVGP